MELEFSTKSRIECDDYLKLIHQNRVYKLSEFIKKFEERTLQEAIIKECILSYRGRLISYDEYLKEMEDMFKNVEYSQIYIKEIFESEIETLIENFDLYRGGKFVHKAEHCLDIALHYLIPSAQYFHPSGTHSWKHNYYNTFRSRSFNLMTSILWYNNCFDYIVQVVFLSQGLYKNIKALSPKSKIETIIKECKVDNVLRELRKSSDNEKLTNLSKILDDFSKQYSYVRELANAIKHKGGVRVNGLELNTTYQIKLLDESGEVTYNSREIEEIEELSIDLDNTISILIEGHVRFVKTIREIVDIIYS